MPRPDRFSSEERDLGLDARITRRDFLDASLLAAGSLLLRKPPAAPEVLRSPVGRVAFANAELHGHQNWLDPTAEGKRVAEQLVG